MTPGHCGSAGDAERPDSGHRQYVGVRPSREHGPIEESGGRQSIPRRSSGSRMSSTPWCVRCARGGGVRSSAEKSTRGLRSSGLRWAKSRCRLGASPSRRRERSPDRHVTITERPEPEEGSSTAMASTNPNLSLVSRRTTTSFPVRQALVGALIGAVLDEMLRVGVSRCPPVATKHAPSESCPPARGEG